MDQRLNDQQCDDSPWTDEEMELLAWEAGARAGWEDLDEYDHYTGEEMKCGGRNNHAQEKACQ
jgi:hypothetical protein